jgi:DNA topoisomerase III
MTTVVICEKTKQAQNVRSAIGSQHGTVMAAQGHLIRLAEPDEVDPTWAQWGTDVLAPPSNRYPFKADPQKRRILDPIAQALKSATTVIIATDADREGQMIGQEILDFVKFRGKVQRVMFSAEDPTSIKNAFTAITDNSKYQSLYQAACARANADQIYNLTLTRAATKAMAGADRRVIGIGRVKTATLAIVCKRHIAIRDFKPTAYFDVGVDVTDGANSVRLWHKRAHTNLLTDKAEARALAAVAASYRGPISVAMKRAIEPPPKPHSLTSLTSAVGKHGIKPKDVLEIAQALYDEHKIATYPRSDVRYLPESMIPDAGQIIAALLTQTPFQALAASGFGQPTIRKGKAGSFSDAGLKGEPHHAIIPNINQIGQLAAVLPKLSKDERLVFEEIARAYLAATGPDHVYDQTDLSIDVVGVPLKAPVRFARVGRVTVTTGWKLAYGQQSISDDEEDDDTASSLPPFKDRTSVAATGTEVAERTTQPPKPIKLAKLPEEMANAWKYVDDPDERERLKEAKGIGQTSTRTTIIEGLLKQKLIDDVKRNAVPTEAGLELYGILQSVAPILNDPGATARMEFRLDEIVEGKSTYDDVLHDIVRQTTHIRDVLVANAKPIATASSASKAPSSKMIAFAQAIATRRNIKLPSNVRTDFSACQAFLNAQTGNGSPQTTASSATPSAGGTASGSAGNATDAQVRYMKTLIEKGAKAPAGWPQVMPTRRQASEFIDKAVKKRA